VRYYKIMFDDERSKKEDIVCTSEEDFLEKYEVKQYDLNEGKYFDDWNSNFTFYYNSKEGTKPTDLLANNLGWFLISQDFQDILKNIGVSEVQFLPVKIVEKNTGKKLEGFSVLNIISLSDALDLTHSTYTEIEARGQKYLTIIKYALSKEKLNGFHIVRLQNSKFASFVSQVVKEQLEINKITGCDFLEVKII